MDIYCEINNNLNKNNFKNIGEFINKLYKSEFINKEDIININIINNDDDFELNLLYKCEFDELNHLIKIFYNYTLSKYELFEYIDDECVYTDNN
jgi:hypothetical protein